MIFALILLALVFLFEAWLWEHLRPLVARVVLYRTELDETMRREFYEIIDGECDRLRRLIDDLLNVSRIEAGRAYIAQ